MLQTRDLGLKLRKRWGKRGLQTHKNDDLLRFEIKLLVVQWIERKPPFNGQSQAKAVTEWGQIR